ncbi:MAG: DUF3343 domain-containing protein [Anaerovoracaceae bacterium]|nr:DUF3343 domain-containing protein [Bacillota bacterium]MEE0517095.1 DUF3343 domain-containing protein [Anaerovoracaceae bacterium]
MTKEYLMAFSSFYKASYALDILSEAGIRAVIRRLPQELLRSCGTGIYLETDSLGEVLKVLEMRQISTRGIYEIVSGEKGGRSYNKI